MEHIRNGIASGRWKSRLPGVRPLSIELGVSRETLRTALHRLETEGTLSPGGTSNPREIRVAVKKKQTGRLRVIVFLARKMELIDMSGRTLILNIIHDLEAAGHSASLVQQPHATDEPSPAALARMVREKPADAWIVFMGSMATLQWFSEQSFPSMALGGRCRDVHIAATGVSFNDAVALATRHLIELGHRRIVYICPKQTRHPTTSPLVLGFEKELRDAGIPIGAFNIPDWDESPAGFHRLLESLFQFTPPTAIIVWNALQVSACLTFFSARNLSVPRDISILSHTSDETILWQNHELGSCEFAWDPQRITRQVVRWVDLVATGDHPREQTVFHATFAPTKTIAPPPNRSARE